MAPPRAPTSSVEVDWEGGDHTVEEAAIRYRYYIAVSPQGGMQQYGGYLIKMRLKTLRVVDY